MKISHSIELYRKALEKQLADEATKIGMEARAEIDAAILHLKNAETKIQAAQSVSRKIGI